MKVFKCAECGKYSYSSADLERQANPGCPYCKAEKPHMTEEAMKNSDICVCCGDYIPEGRMVCTRCEKDPQRSLERK